ncbi:MAG: LamG domain-containing protein [Planctomycetota bacterium]|jgi:hypothetical protein
MCRKLSCLICLVVVLGLVNIASAGIQLKIDLCNRSEEGAEPEVGPWPKSFKGEDEGGWTPWWFWGDDDDGHDGVFIKGFAGMDVNIGFCVAEGDSDPGTMLQFADHGEEKICNTWLESTKDAGGGGPARSDGDIHLVIMGRELIAGEYSVLAYHNNPEDVEDPMPYIHAGTYCDGNSLDNLPVPSTNDCTGVVQIHDGETIDTDVPIQSLSYEYGLDGSLTTSLIKFTTDGNSSVLIKYRAAVGSSAVINAFIIELAAEPVTALWPDPKVDAEDVNLCDLQLSWEPGIKVQDTNAHEIYFGTDPNFVRDANIDEPCGVYMGAQDSNTYPEVGGLNLMVDTTYYWRVDEVNEDDPNIRWKGTLWFFKTHSGKGEEPFPEDEFRGFRASDVNAYYWDASCAADTHKVYFGVDLPEHIDLFDDGFESEGGFDPNWVSVGWELVDANKLVPPDMNLCHSPNVAAYATGGGIKTLTSAEVNLADACSIDVGFYFRKTKEVRIVDNEIKLYYWDGDNWDYIKDMNTWDPCTNKWIHWSDDINVLDKYHLQTDFKIKLEANITHGGTVYVDDLRIRNTWPAAAKWYIGRQDSNSQPVSLQPLTKYYWRIDTVMDGNRVEAGNVVQGDWWTFSSGVGGLIMWCTFDSGNIGEAFPTTYQPDTETGRTIEFTKYTDPGGWVRYGEGNPMYSSGATSANFDPNAGLYRLDPCLPKESEIRGVKCIDPLRLDGYQYTIEMWLKPTNLSERKMDDQVLITKGGDSDSDDDGDEWAPGEWGVFIKDPGSDSEEDENSFFWAHPYGGLNMGAGGAINDEWSHIAAVYNKEHPNPERQFSTYYNGVLAGYKECSGFNSAEANSPVSIGFGLDNDANFVERNNYFFGMIDELRIYDIALKPYQLLLTPGPEWASNPRPVYGQVGVEPNDPNLALIWNPGTKAVSHKVYLSTDFEDVNTGDPKAYWNTYDTNEANDVNAFIGLGRTYYWRVDEVNGPCTWPGVIWKFSTEFPILNATLICWYPFEEDSGKFVTDHSGYGNHSELDTSVARPDWETTGGHFGGCLGFDDDTSFEVPLDVLDRVTTGITISVWLYGLADDWDEGSNVVMQAGAGAMLLEVQVPDDDDHRDVYWRAGDDVNDAVTWEVDTSGLHNGWHHFAFVKDESADKMYIYLDGGQVWWKPGDTDSSLSLITNREFRIGAEIDEDEDDGDYIGKMDDFRVYDYAKPEGEIEELYRGGDLAIAWGPAPYDGQTDARRDVNVAWNAGDYADSHDVYFGTDYNSVRDANISEPCDVFRGNQAGTVNDIEILELDTQYFWRIDEVKDSNGFRWKGNVWKFKVADYLMIDDFEWYEDAAHIKQYWCDGQWCSYTNWSQVTLGVYDAANPKYPSHGGDQMMRYAYDNYSGAPFWSEVYLPLEKVGVTDWTQADVKALTLFLYGEPPPDGYEDHDQMYVAINDTDGKYAEIRYGDYERVAVEDINDLNEPAWHRWFIGLSDFNDPCYAEVPNDVNLTDVNRLFIGFGDKRNPPGVGPFGEILFDDIRLSRSICVPKVIKPVGDFRGRRGKPDCVVDLWDLAYFVEHQWLRDDANLVDIVQEPCDANLVGHWKLDGDPCDSSIYDHNYTIKGYEEYSWVVGHANDLNPSDGAVDFKRGLGGILVDDHNELKPKYAVSVSAWVYFTESQDDAPVVVKGAAIGKVDKYTSSQRSYMMTIDDYDELHFEIADTCVGRYDAQPEFDDDEKAEKKYKERMLGRDILYPDAWAHVAGTFDSDTNTVRAYVNAVLVDEANDANSISWTNVRPRKTLSQDPNRLAIGRMPENRWGERFKGRIDEVRIYNYALDANEVAWLATDGTGYRRLRSQLNLYDLEAEGEKSINFKDLAVFIDEHWLEVIKWP